MPLLDAAADTPLACDRRPCRSIFGHKHDAIAYLDAFGADLWHSLEYQFELGASEDLMLRTMLRVPGIGLAKGGFMLQMCYGLSGCLDTHNVTRFGLPERRYASGHKDTDTRRASEYNEVCARLGGTAELWDTWCEYLAERDGRYLSAQEVSRLHLAPLN